MMSTSPIAPLTFAALVAGAMLGAGCHRGAQPGAAPAPAAGTERGACRPDRSCDRGLTCLSELCVRPPAADCAKVGDAMSYLLLDNYAPRDERDALRAAIAKQCADENLSADDGACLVRARSRADLRACPHLVGLGDCAKITAHLDGLRATGGVDAYLVTGADRVIARCKNETPTLAFERCVMATHTVDDVDRCVW